MSSFAETYDHNGKPVIHHRYRINGIRMHFITAGSGPPLLLLHGTPKNSFYWYKIAPLLTPHFTIVAPDLRGFGYTDKPPTTDGYSSVDAADDMAELMTKLGHKEFYLHGEDRGAEYAYALSAKYRDRVLKLSFGEMVLGGFGLEETNVWNYDNISRQFEQRGIWCWHLSFFYIPHVPEMLIQGREREFWEMFIKGECYNPCAIEPVALDHWVECSKQPGTLRGILETYRAGLKNGDLHQQMLKEGGKLTLPIMAIGAPEFFGPQVEEGILKVAEKVQVSHLFEECGHSLALEKPERLAKCLREFLLEEGK